MIENKWDIFSILKLTKKKKRQKKKIAIEMPEYLTVNPIFVSLSGVYRILIGNSLAKVAE